MESEEFEWDDDKNAENIGITASVSKQLSALSMMSGRYLSPILNTAVLASRVTHCSECANPG